MKNVGRDLTVAALAAGTTLGAAGILQSSRPANLSSSVFTWESARQETTTVGSRRSFFDSPTATLENLEIHATTLNPNEASHPPHQHPDEELVIVKEGTLEVTINGNTQRVGPGAVVFYASNDLHGMRNAGDTPVTYHVIRWISTATPKTVAQP